MEDKPVVRGGRDGRGRFLPGNLCSLRHGRYAYLHGAGGGLRGTRTLSKRLAELRTSLVDSVGEMSTQKEILVDRVVSLEGLIRLTELYLRQAGIVRPDSFKRGLIHVQPSLERWYLGALNSQRLSLQALGLDKKPEPVPTFAEIVKRIDEAKAKAGAIDTGGGVEPSKNEDEEKAAT